MLDTLLLAVRLGPIKLLSYFIESYTASRLRDCRSSIWISSRASYCISTCLLSSISIILLFSVYLWLRIALLRSSWNSL